SNETVFGEAWRCRRGKQAWRCRRGKQAGRGVAYGVVAAQAGVTVTRGGSWAGCVWVWSGLGRQSVSRVWSASVLVPSTQAGLVRCPGMRGEQDTQNLKLVHLWNPLGHSG
ncbi:hypothetical protein Hamer_G012336, partial [Homarus americanus]